MAPTPKGRVNSRRVLTILIVDWIFHVTSEKDILPSHFDQGPKLCAMIKYASLCRELVYFIKKGAMSYVACTKAFQDLWALQPDLVKKVRKSVTLALQLSRALRTVLCWFREFAKGKAVALLKKATEADEVPWALLS